MSICYSLHFKSPEVSILLLTWNRAQMLRRCLRSLFAALSPEMVHEVIIMDNASTDETRMVLKEYEGRPDVRIVHNRKNLRLNAYKSLFGMARGKVMIEVDDDVLEFPQGFDKGICDYFKTYSDYGFLALNVVQNDKTNGAKPGPECYKLDVRGEMTVEEGPVGGWCAAFHRWHYRLFAPFINLLSLSMARGEDGVLSALLTKVLRKRQGIIRDLICLHATGQDYAREFGTLKREEEKYRASGLDEFADRCKE